MAVDERRATGTVGSALVDAAAQHPDAPFVILDQDRLSFADVERQSARLAAALHDLGVAQGDRVALLLPSWPEFVVSLFAAARLGAVIVPLEPRLSPGELRYLVRHSESVAVIAVDHWEGIDHLASLDVLLDEQACLRFVVTVGDEDGWYDDRILRYQELVNSSLAGRTIDDAGVKSDDLFALLYTAGTSGKPRGVELTHGNVLHTSRATAQAFKLTSADLVAGVPALFHVFGLGPGVLGCLSAGAGLILSERHEPGALLDLVEAHGVTVLFGLPTVFLTEMAAQASRPRNLSSLRLGVAAGAAVSPELVRRIESEFCPTFVVAYSMTETGATVAMTRPDDTPERRRTTVGRPLADTEVRVLQGGVALPVESIGEIAVRGPGVMRGFHRQPALTAALFDDEGFLRTGDLGMIDEDGFMHLVGGNDHVIFRAGFKFYPRLVEERIRSHPAVDGAVVVGLPDPVLGQATCACVIPVEGAMLSPDEVRNWCAEALVPDSVPDHVRFLDSFPRASDGRVRRGELMARLGTSAVAE